MKNLLLLAICILCSPTVYGQENKEIKEKLEAKYGFASYNLDGYYYVYKGTYMENGGNAGVCDSNGKEIIPPVWDNVSVPTSGKCVKVWKNGKVGIRDFKNKEIIECKYDEIYTPIDPNNEECKYYRVYLGNNIGIMDIKGKELIPCIYSYVGLLYLSQETIIIGRGGILEQRPGFPSGAKYAIYNNMQKKFVTDFKYDYIDFDHENIRRFNIGGVIVQDNNGNRNIKVEGGKWGYIDNEGKEIIPSQYEMVTNIKDGIATVTRNGKTTEINISNDNLLTNLANSVDVSIPQTESTNNKIFAIVVGNEKYSDEADVPYAENDAKVFKEYCQQTLGVSENHIRYIANAGYNDFRRSVNWLKQGLEAYGGEGSAIFYYAGHGIPDEAQKTAYILPVDGIGSDIESAYSLERLYQTLGEMPAKSITVFLDACFSGAKRDGGMMASARGVAIKTKAEEPKGNMVVFSAAQGDETAYPYKSQQHGMFTYYLLRKLQETKGDVTLGELADYITREVKRQSFDENSRSQTPTVNASTRIVNSWRNLKLK